MKVTASILRMSFCAITAKNFVKVILPKSSTYNIKEKVEDSQAEQILTCDRHVIAEMSLSGIQWEWH